MFNYVKIYNDVVSDSKCKELIDRFESDTKCHEIQNNGNETTLTQINLLNSSNTIWKDDANFLVNVIMEHVEKYKKDCDIKSFQWPDKFGIEPLKIKRYLPDTTDMFPDHVDVLDYKTARRFLIMFLYLNNNEGGQTIIKPKDDTFVSFCKRGSLLIFPSFWPCCCGSTIPAGRCMCRRSRKAS